MPLGSSWPPTTWNKETETRRLTGAYWPLSFHVHSGPPSAAGIKARTDTAGAGGPRSLAVKGGLRQIKWPMKPLAELRKATRKESKLTTTFEISRPRQAAAGQPVQRAPAPFLCGDRPHALARASSPALLLCSPPRTPGLTRPLLTREVV